MDRVTIQIGGQAFRCAWRDPAGAERAAIRRFMTEIYPSYRDYRAATERQIPLIRIAPGEAMAVLQN